MPNYTSHIIFNFVVLFIIYIVIYDENILTLSQLIIFSLSYLIGTTLITPDLDIKSKCSKWLGILSLPYRKILKHRGISHHWLFGILTRIVYFSLILMIFISSFLLLTEYNVFIFLNITFQLFVEYKIETFLFFIGLFLSNLMHVFLDKL